uniref:Reactive oxygen species modulator 1 n=1 Tax=Nothoprocta perdicaria TaxID=30464 RepID=A0A8C6YWW7_NOTPE
MFKQTQVTQSRSSSIPEASLQCVKANLNHQFPQPSCFQQNRCFLTNACLLPARASSFTRFLCFFSLRIGMRGRELMGGVGKTMMQSGGTFGTFMAIGMGIRC